MKNKGGAPKKNDNEKLQYRKNLSFNEPEHDMLTEKGLADGRILKTIVLNSLSGKKIQINTNKDPKFIGELNRIGININQIAKKCNSSDELTASDLSNLWAALDELKKLIMT